MKRFPISIVDDFLPDPDYVADLARNTEYLPTRSSAPGHRSNSLHDLDYPLYEFLGNKVLGLHWDVRRERDLLCNASFDFLRVTPDEDPECNVGLVHKDVGEPCNDFVGTELAGVIYLNKNSGENTGTSIYKQKHSYVLTYDPYKEIGDVVRNYNRTGVNKEKFKTALRKYNDNFEEVVRVQNLYNRMICYPGDQWHVATTYGQPGDETRYILRMFFKNIYGMVSTYPLDRMAFNYKRFDRKNPGTI